MRLGRIITAFFLALSLLLGTVSVMQAGTNAIGNAADILYVVRWGDNLSSVAWKFGTTVRAIVELNHIWNANYIRAGQVLIIPQGGGPGPMPAPGGNKYIVRPGDTLSGIAYRFGVSVRSLAAYNGIWNVNYIRYGQVLYIPGGAGGPAAPVAASSEMTPTKAMTATAPMSAAKPITSTTPITPTGVTPTKPVTPTTPLAPTTPVTPTKPVTPTTPVAPTAPVTSTSSTTSTTGATGAPTVEDIRVVPATSALGIYNIRGRVSVIVQATNVDHVDFYYVDGAPNSQPNKLGTDTTKEDGWAFMWETPNQSFQGRIYAVAIGARGQEARSPELRVYHP